MEPIFETTLASRDLPAVRLGFLPLTDCAPLVVAQHLGLGGRHGLRIELQRLPSWAALRDALLSGEVHAAHALYGMALGMQLGVAGPRDDVSILMALNRNGQAITLSRPLAARLQQGKPLAQVFAELGRRPVLAHTFPTGTHAIWLHRWLRQGGVDPLRDVQMIVIPPPLMADAMAARELDGFCAGEPWHAVATAREVGATVACTSELWPDHPEKALVCRRAWASLRPDLAVALIRTLLDACRWLQDASRLPVAAQWLASPEVIGVASNLILPRMLGDYGTAPLRALPRPVSFGRNRPESSEAVQLLDDFRAMRLWDGAEGKMLCDALCEARLFDAAANVNAFGGMVV